MTGPAHLHSLALTMLAWVTALVEQAIAPLGPRAVELTPVVILVVNYVQTTIHIYIQIQNQLHMLHQLLPQL